MTNNQLSTKATTLIEILVVLAVASILLGVSYFGYRERGQELALQRAAQKLVTDIERAREMAMSARKLEGSEIIPEGGYGFNFNISSPFQYILFADLPSPNKIYSGATERVETISLETGIKLIGLVPSSPLNIVFLAPSPDTFIQAGAVNSAEITIAIESSPSKTKKIYINAAGLVSISN